MSKQNLATSKIRTPSGLVTIAEPPASRRKPLAFDRQLVEAQRLAAPSRIEALYTRITQSIRSFGQRMLKRRGRRRQLDLEDIQQLGEKRFVAVLRVGKQKFLIGGAAGSISLLAEFTPPRRKAAAMHAHGQDGA
jgi:hypothetical protein